MKIVKRFTETLKWADPWFRSLTIESKLLWLWLLDNCDHSGVIRPDFELAAFQIGKPINHEHIVELGERLQTLPDGKLHIPKFIRFQYGVDVATLSEGSSVHRGVVKALRLHGLLDNPSVSLRQALPKALKSVKDKDKDKEKEGGVAGGANLAVEIYNAYPLKVGRPIALRSIEKAMKKTDPAKLLELTRRFAVARNGDKAFMPHPATWFNQERFNDDPATWVRGESHEVQTQKPSAAPSVYGLTKIIEAKRAQATDLFNQHATETGMSTTWTNERVRLEYRELKAEIKQLTAKLGSIPT